MSLNGPLVGTKVDLHSLVGRADLNGCRGVVEKALDSVTGRVGVHVDGEATLLALKLANLTWEDHPVDVSEDADTDPVLAAVQRLLLADPDLPPKQVHATLIADQAWASTSLGAVKRACSKLSKGGGAAPVPSGTTDALEDSATSRLGPTASMDVCHKFAKALWARLTGCSVPQTEQGLVAGKPLPAESGAIFECLLAEKPTPGRRKVCLLDFGAIGHSFVLELATDAEGRLRARPFSAWVRPEGEEDAASDLATDSKRIRCMLQGVPQAKPDAKGKAKAKSAKGSKSGKGGTGSIGYMANEWCMSPLCVWWTEEQLRVGCERVSKLRALTEHFVASHLRDAAPPGLTREARATWAGALCAAVEQDPLMQQPVKMSGPQADQYSTQMAERGLPPHAVLFRLQGNQLGNAEQLLDFPLRDAAPIAELIAALFGEVPVGYTWLRMLEFDGRPSEGWAYLVGDAGRAPNPTELS